VYTVLADSDTFGTGPQRAEGSTADGGVCCGGSKPAGDETQPASAAACR
jgi:hypothetical protein